MNKFLTVLVALLTLWGVQAKAEEKVAIQSAEITAGAEFTLPIELINENTYKAFQMDIVLPQGITPVLNKKGKIVPVKDEDRFDDTDHSFSYNLVDNTIKLVCTSMNADEISGNEGTLFTINLKADDNLAGGSYEIKLTGVKFTDVDNQGHPFADATATFTVPGGSTPEPTTYTYQFKADGEVLSSGELAAGEALTAPTAPSKDGYTFTGWNPAFTGTMPEADVVYEAVYTENSVTPVTDGDRVVIQSAEISAGAEFALPIALFNEKTYKAFQMDIVLPTGITPVLNGKGKIVPVKNDERFDDTDHSFSYNYVDNTIKLVCTSLSADEISGNSGTLFSINLKAADDLASGTYTIALTNVKFTDDNNQGHTFADATATFTIPAAKYTYQFKADGIVLSSGELAVGETLTAPDVPAKEYFVFTGWTPAFTGTMPAENVIYEAVYAVDGLDRVIIKNGETANGAEFDLPVILVNQNTYKAFQMDIVLPEGVTPVLNGKGKIDFAKNEDRFDETDHSFSYNYVDSVNTIKLVCTSMNADEISGNSGTLFTIKLNADKRLKVPFNINLANVKFTTVDNEGSTFDDATATFTVNYTPAEFNYQFKNDDETIISGTAEAETTITAPEDPTKTGYTFAGWNPAFDGKMPNDDVTYVAVWTVNQYKMTFVLDNGLENVESSLDFGSAIVAPADTTKTGYTFAGWNPELPATVPAEDKTFTAQWTINQYTMTFKLENGSEDVVMKQDYASTLEAPVPTKTGYTFAGWDADVPATVPAADQSFTAQWTLNSYKVTFNVDGQTTESMVSYGTAIPTPTVSPKEGYTFTGWAPEVPATMPAGDQTFTAQWTVNKYWVTFLAEGTEVSKTQMEYNAAIVAPQAPEFEGKRFMKWAPEVDATVPAHDVTYEAVYALIVRDTIYIEVHDTTYVDVIVHDTLRLSTLQRVDAPFINVTTDGKIELSCEQKNAMIFYTTDGTVPSTTSQLYTEPFTVADGTTIQAVAVLISEVAKMENVGIKNVRMTPENGKIYNLQGRQVSKAARGVFIQNGKKIVVK